MASTYLTKTNSGTGSETKATFSAWIKISNFGDDNTIFREYESSGNYISIKLKSGAIQVYGQNNSSAFVNVKTERLLRDFNGWYHAVVAIDSTQSTAADRIKIYINGVQETALASTTYPGSSANCKINQNNEVQTIGGAGSSEYFDGYLSHVHWVDGTAYAASTFGSTDSTTGEWKINTSPTITMGTNGFTILKDGNTITDQSSNSNNFSLGGGTLTKSEDCPSNVFATLNPVIRSSNGTFASGNNKFTTSGGAWGSGFTTLGMFNGQGKYYMEFKGASGTKIGYGISDFKQDGVIDRTQRDETRYCGEYANSYAYHYGGNFYYSGSSTSTGYDSFTSSNVIGMAVDMDNLKIYFHKDGVYQDSKNPASNNGYTIVAPEGVYLPTITVEDAGATVNFGNGVFDTTAISSAGTNASGIGVFEYDVPTGYTALSTKGLNL